MCTLSIIPLSVDRLSGYRMVSSRDESRDRSEAKPPRWRELSETLRGIWPTDPEGGGTWVAVANSGLGLALLNRNPEPPIAIPPPGPLVSRGKLIPKLIDSASLAEVAQRLRSMPLDRFAPFRILATAFERGQVHCVEVVWDRSDLDVKPAVQPPLCLVSSGLGDSRVQARLPLFSDLVKKNPNPEAQDAFHKHVWRDRREISVLMERPDATTVSITTCDVLTQPDGRPAVRMGYAAVKWSKAHSTPQLARGRASV